MRSQLWSPLSSPAATFPAIDSADGESAATGGIDQRAAFPPIAMGICIFAAILLVILAAAEGFTATRRAFAAFAALSSFAAALFLIYRDVRNEQRIAYMFGALGIMVGATYINGFLALVAMATPFPPQDKLLSETSAAIGFDYTAIMRWIAERPPTGRLMQLSYMICGPMIFAAPIVLAWTRQFSRLRRFVTLYALLITLCVTISFLVPARGFALYAPLPADVARALPGGAATFFGAIADGFRYGALRTLDPAYFQGVVEFPSFHTATALLTIYAFWRTRFLWVVALAGNVMVLLSVVPIGGHYIWDVVAAALLFFAALPLVRRWDERSAHPSR